MIGVVYAVIEKLPKEQQPPVQISFVSCLMASIPNWANRATDSAKVRHSVLPLPGDCCMGAKSYCSMR